MLEVLALFKNQLAKREWRTHIFRRYRFPVFIKKTGNAEQLSVVGVVSLQPEGDFIGENSAYGICAWPAKFTRMLPLFLMGWGSRTSEAGSGWAGSELVCGAARAGRERSGRHLVGELRVAWGGHRWPNSRGAWARVAGREGCALLGHFTPPQRPHRSTGVQLRLAGSHTHPGRARSACLTPKLQFLFVNGISDSTGNRSGCIFWVITFSMWRWKLKGKERRTATCY